MKFLDVFAGIGGFRLALELEGFKCIGSIEINHHCRRFYQSIFNTSNEFYHDDILSIDVNKIPDFDVMTAGFPCQPFSNAGKREGLRDERGSKIWEKMFEILRIKQPTHFIGENVKGLLSQDQGKAFAYFLCKMDECGYDVEWDLFDSRWFNVPQARERIFIVGHLRNKSRCRIFPIREKEKVTYRIHEQTQETKERICPENCHGSTITPKDRNYNTLIASVLTAHNSIYSKCTILSSKKRHEFSKDNSGSAKTLLSSDCAKNNHMTLIKLDQTNGNMKKRVQERKESWTLDTTNNMAIMQDWELRVLSCLERFRLQGFPDNFHQKAAEMGFSRSMISHFTGNTITVQIAQTIARKLDNEKIRTRNMQMSIDSYIKNEVE